MRIYVVIALTVISLSSLYGQEKRTIYTAAVPVDQEMTSSLPDWFRYIQQQAGYLFVYQPGLVDHVNATALAGTYTVAQLLDHLFKNTPLSYSESSRNIIVFKKPVLRTVTGQVFDSQTRQPIPGASVSIIDTDKGVQTDEDGKFSIEVIQEDEINFTYVGMKPKRVQVGATIKFDIELEAIELTTVVINGGYYHILDGEETGNIEHIDRKEITRQPVGNVLQSLQGRLAGVLVEQLSGLPGAGMNVRIRGQNSLRSDGNDPLYLINGIPYPSHSMSSVITAGEIIPNSSSMNGIAPAMIESIDILKDADATAIYGSRGANGVVLITTRKTVEPGNRISLSIHTGVSEVPKFIELLNSKQWLEMRREAFKNDGVTPDQYNAPDLKQWDTTRYTDWQRKLIGGASRFTDASFTVSAGQKDVKLLASYNLNKQGSVSPGSFGYSRGSGLLYVQFTPLKERIKVETSVNFSRENNELPPIDMTKRAVELSPVAPDVYTPENDLNWQDGTWLNPFSHLRNTFRATSQTLLASSKVSYSISRSIDFKVSAGYTDTRREEIRLSRISSQNPKNSSASITGTNYNSQASISSWIIEPQVEYAKRFKWGYVEFLAGTTFQRSLQKGMTLIAYGYRTDAVLESIPSAPHIESYGPSDNEYSYSAAYTRLNYNYKGKYILNLTGRRDASSRFAPGMLANFGAVGAAWIFTKEEFVLKSSFIDHGKVRVSYGTTGNDQIDDYGFLDDYSIGDYAYGGQSGIYPTAVANSRYSWELSKKFETELQFGFFGNRLRIDLVYYRNNSTKQLLNKNIPATTGFESVLYNMPVEVRNSGIEITINTLPITSDVIKWNASINVTLPQTTLVRYDNIQGSSDAWRYVVGKSVNILKRYKYTGINTHTGNFSYVDVNGDGIYSDKDLQPTKTYGVHWYGGLENVITYRGFQFAFLIQYVKQTKQSIVGAFTAPGSFFTNQPVEVMERWQGAGDNSIHHKFTQRALGQREYNVASLSGENAYMDASFMRVKNMELMYSLPKRVSGKLSLSSSALFVRGQNLLTIADYYGFDPENANPYVLPPLRTVTMGVQIIL